MEYLQALGPFLNAQLVFLSIWNTVFALRAHRSEKIKLENLKSSQPDSPNHQPERADSAILDTEVIHFSALHWNLVIHQVRNST